MGFLQIAKNILENISPVDGKILTKIPRSNEKDIDLAIEAAKKGLNNLNIHQLLKEVLY